MVEAEPNILWPEVTKFVSQLNHDLRNHLNAVELQAALLGELVEEPEAREEIKRLREMTGELNAHLHKLSGGLAKVRPQLMSYPAADFAEDLRAKLNLEEPEQSAEIDWRASLGQEMLEIDPQLLQEAFLELFANANTHARAEGPLVFEVRPEGKTVEFSLREPKMQLDGATENWGARPLQQVRSGHYGLGLFRARSIFEAHHGQYQVQFDPAASVLQTVVSLPCSGGQ
jgi:light-regulated signal transduction histidine kinase (bacteriophytochrome)